MKLRDKIKGALGETNLIVKADDLEKIEPQLSDDDVVKVVDESEEIDETDELDESDDELEEAEEAEFQESLDFMQKIMDIK